MKRIDDQTIAVLVLGAVAVFALLKGIGGAAALVIIVILTILL